MKERGHEDLPDRDTVALWVVKESALLIPFRNISSLSCAQLKDTFCFGEAFYCFPRVLSDSGGKPAQLF